MASKLKPSPLLEQLWGQFNFRPNDNQSEAILHASGPLFLPAGPGSGKTRVLLWRTVNLITEHGVKLEEIFLSTFTEKAALQLHNGLRTLLAAVTQKTGTPYDTAQLYVGTVHSLCRRILTDRRFSVRRARARPPVMLDDLDQYMFVRNKKVWTELIEAMGLGNLEINTTFGDHGQSRYKAIAHLLSFFNRLSEEMIDPEVALKRAKDPATKALLRGYRTYREMLRTHRKINYTDLSLLQSAALDHLRAFPESKSVFRHVIVDEYQDTNPVQEQIFFHLAQGHRNFSVVGDDDQALYRFRGATVENFVDFPARCTTHLKTKPRRILLNTNYRSRADIVDFYNRFIVHPHCDWMRGPRGAGAYRVMDKKIIPHSTDSAPAVIASSAASPDDVAAEVAKLVKQLIVTRRVEDPNQIAFLFPSLGAAPVARMRAALENLGLSVYAPRAGRFLDVPEARAVFGLLFHVFGIKEHQHSEFTDWIQDVRDYAGTLIAADRHLRDFIEAKRKDLAQVASDYRLLAARINEEGYDLKSPFDPNVLRSSMLATDGLSNVALRTLRSPLLSRFASQRLASGSPFSVGYVLTRAASLDWTLLDFFYQLAGFRHFKAMFDLAESGGDEGPVCNLSLISRYLSRFLDTNPSLVPGEWVEKGTYANIFLNFLYALYRRGESEHEDADDPFPRGRIPFITVHQSKGLEFPVVILGNPRKDAKIQSVEERVAPLLTRVGEPLDRMPQFDVMRMFYVALSRAKNLLVLTDYHGRGQRLHPVFRDLIDSGVTRIPDFDPATVPPAELEQQELPRSYSYTADFLLYQRCPRQYMLFRAYGFAPARSLTMFFGSLVHQSIEDLHQHLISQREVVP